MTPQDFEFIASLLKEHSGFSLVPSQLYLLESRLGPVLRQNNLIGLEDLVTSLKLNNVELRKSVIEAVSVNNTRFFRNKYVFNTIENFLSNKLRQNPNIPHVRILSAGCASGQEPVSIALLLHEMKLVPKIPLTIYALDMSRTMIERAKKALYSHYEVQKGLPIRLLLKYFTLCPNDHWHLNADVLKDIHYQVHNLMNLFDENDFDIVLCRNMLSFMTEEAQDTALLNLSQIMNQDGLLIIGASEVLHDNPYFEKVPDKIACYRLRSTHDQKVAKRINALGWNFSKKPLFKSALSEK